ncbi:hypothetical protein BC629DRAFT_1590026 [Irpex lacteus]|nr:hypothetical protein BC629DRAFT_1590026 [Irpex lacteus]
MARSTQRTQRASQSQSQSQPSQSQRAPRGSQRARRRDADEEEEEDPDEEEQENDNDMDVDDGNDDDADLQRRAYALVRLALFNEQRRIPLRRDEISKKVLGSKGRRFAEAVDDTDKDGKKPKKNTDALGMKKKAAPTGTKTWICAPREQQPDSDEDDDPDDSAVKSANTGAIVAWQNADQLSAIGILYVVLALVLVHGRAISDADLRRLLKRLRIPLTASLPLTARSPTQLTIDAFLAQSTRQGYLERHRIGEAKPATKKRGRGAPGGTNNDEEGETWEWRWGPRAMAEVGEKDLAGFVAEFMVGRALVGGDGDGDEEEEEQEVSEEKRRKDLEGMLRGVERASGGDLVDCGVVVV